MARGRLGVRAELLARRAAALAAVLVSRAVYFRVRYDCVAGLQPSVSALNEERKARARNKRQLSELINTLRDGERRRWDGSEKTCNAFKRIVLEKNPDIWYARFNWLSKIKVRKSTIMPGRWGII